MSYDRENIIEVQKIEFDSNHGLINGWQLKDGILFGLFNEQLIEHFEYKIETSGCEF